MNEQQAGRLETAGARAKAIFGAAPQEPTGIEAAGGTPPPNDRDIALIATRLERHASMPTEEARAAAAELVSKAQAAVQTVWGGGALDQNESWALESVMQARGRPALRVLNGRLEDLSAFPGSELWQTLMVDHETQMVAAAAATGAAMVSAFDTGNPPWVQGSAWLIADDRVVTNRHVLRSTDLDLIVVDASGVRFRHGVSMTIEFAADNRNPAATVSKRVTEILYVSDRQDPVDIAVLRIDGGNAAPLTLATGPAPRNLYVVGHPGLALSVSETVRVVFGNPDGRKRVSFGKRLDVELRRGEFLHDASTVGGFSGGPVVGMLDGTVIGLHYYGDPQTGNMAFSTDKVRADPAFHYLA